MERLTEREAYWFGEEFWISAKEPDGEEIDEVYMKLKHYEDLEEQGLLLKLPCKVGTTVYDIKWWNNIHETVEVDGKIYYRTVCKHKVSKSTFSVYDIESFGKEVFLTKEEAEAKLKELENVRD